MRTVQVVLLPPAGGELRVVTVPNAPSRSPRCIAVVPGADVLGREVAIAGATPAQRQAATLAGLAASLAAPASQLTCVMGKERQAAVAFVAAHDRIEGWRKMAASAGFAPDTMLPDYALLTRPAAGVAHVADRGDAVVRTSQGGFACQPDLLPVLTEGLQRVEVDFEAALTSAVRAGLAGEAPNLLAAQRATALTKQTRFPVLAVGVAAAFALACAVPWIDAYRLGAEAAALRAQTVELARNALPNARRIVDPLAQLREAAAPKQHAEQLLDQSAGLLEGLAISPNVRMSRLELGGDGVVRASLSTPDLIQLQPLRDYLAKAGLRATETPKASSANQLNVELQVATAR